LALRGARRARGRAARFACTLAISLLPVCGPAAGQNALPLDRIRLQPGFAIETVARVPSARAMTWGAEGTLFAGTSGGGVYTVTLPRAGSADAARVHAVAPGLRDPSGVAFRSGALYVSAVSRIVRFDDIERRLDSPPQPVVVTDA
jgi:hypothetical protein